MLGVGIRAIRRDMSKRGSRGEGERVMREQGAVRKVEEG